jgi:hypothetical protein
MALDNSTVVETEILLLRVWISMSVRHIVSVGGTRLASISYWCLID